MKTPVYKNPGKPVEARVRDLLGRMTLEEKAAQLMQRTIGRDTNPNNVGPDHPFDPLVGSVLSAYVGTAARNAFQRIAVEETRLGIPIVWGYDVIHGWRTAFPVPLAQACSFDPSLTEKGCRVAAEECHADGGIDWTFSPMVEVGHDPRWGRNVEGYGEDPFTASRFAEAAVRGYQGRRRADLKKHGRIAACLKHFVGYSAAEGGRDYSYTDVSARALREWYLPPFEAGVRAGARTVMSSFNCIGGTPCVANKGLLSDVLRGEWGFDGFVVSDWGAVSQLRIQRFSSDPAVQTAAALGAGNDMDMADDVYRNVPALVRAGKLPMRVVDRAVARVLRVKFELGLFENPYVPERPIEETCRLPASLDLAAECARSCAVLLKNDPPSRHSSLVTRHPSPGAKPPILPLDPRKIGRLALVGPAADDCPALVGTWAGLCAKNHEEVPSLLDEAPRFFPHAKIDYAPGCLPGPGRRATVDFVPGCPLDPDVKPDRAAIAKAVRAARAADVVVVALGEPGWFSGENKSRRDIRLSSAQEALVDALAATGKPLVGLVAAGRPLAFQETAAKLDAVLYLWQGGSRAAQAAWELVTGAANPSGRLAMTFPRAVGQIPVFYNRQARSRENLFDYLDVPQENDPWFSFGHGLSYTTFEYGKVRLAKVGRAVPANRISAAVTVKNTGKRAGSETVIWYLSDLEGTSTQPVRRVVGFEKIPLEPGESKTVRLSLSRKDLAAMQPDGTRRFEPGAFELSASLRASARFDVA